MSNPESDCTGEIYTVQPGDTLNQIAQKYGVTVEKLLGVNPQIENPNRIFVGQIICIPTETVVSKKSVMIMTYTEYLASISQFIARTVESLVVVQQLEKGRSAVTFFVTRLPAPKEIEDGEFDSYIGELNIAGERYFANLEAVIEEFSYTVRGGTITIEKPILIGTIVIPANPFTAVESKTAIKLYNQTTEVQSDPLLVGRVSKQELELDCEGANYVVQPGNTLYQIAQNINISVNTLISANPQLEDPGQLSIGQPLCIPPGVVPLRRWAVVLASPEVRELSSIAGGVALFNQLAGNNYSVTFAVTGLPALGTIEDGEFNSYLAVVEVNGAEYSGVLKKTVPRSQEPTWAGIVVISDNPSVTPKTSKISLFPFNQTTKARGDSILISTPDIYKFIQYL